MKKFAKFISLLLALTVLTSNCIALTAGGKSTVSSGLSAAREIGGEGVNGNETENPVKLSLYVPDMAAGETAVAALKVDIPSGIRVDSLQADFIYDATYFTSGEDPFQNGKVTFVSSFGVGEGEKEYSAFSITAKSSITEGYYYVFLTSAIILDEEGNQLEYKAENSCKFAVRSSVKPDISMTISPREITLAAGSSRTLNLTVTPDNLLDGAKKVEWYSSDENIASVDQNGCVTALSAGETNINIKYDLDENGVYQKGDTCKVTVFEASLSSAVIERSPYRLNYFVGEEVDTAGLKVRIFPDAKSSVSITEGFDVAHEPFDKAGEYTVSVNCSGYFVNYNVTVSDENKPQSKFTVYSSPNKDTFTRDELIDGLWPDIKGFALENEGGVLAHFNANNPDWQFSGSYRTPKIGLNRAQVAFGGYVFDFDFILKEDDAPDSIWVNTPPAWGQDFGTPMNKMNLFGLSVYARTGDADTLILNADLEFPTAKLDKAENIVTVSYKGLRDYFVAVVEIPPLDAANGIQIAELPAKTEYFNGEKILLDGLKVAAVYNGSVIGYVEDYTVQQPEYTVGKNTVTVRWGEFSAEFTVTVSSEPVPVPDKITSGVYTVKDGYVLGITAGQTVKELLAGINERDFAAVYDAAGNICGDNMPVATGMKIYLINPLNGERTASATAVAAGDLDGDGAVTGDDFDMLLKYLTGGTELDGAALAAADFDLNGEVDISDLMYIRDRS